MIEIRMVERMVKRALFLAPVLAAVLFLWGGLGYVLSGLIGLALAVLNLWFAARLIGRTAERDPQMLMVAGMAALFTALIILTAAGFILRRAEWVSLPAFGLSLVGSHLGLVLWETASAPLDSDDPVHEKQTQAQTRS